MIDLISSTQNILKAIEIARAVGGQSSVKLIAATKQQSVETITGFIKASEALKIIPICAENYAQELEAKKLAFKDIEFHFIGRLQRNKAALVAEFASTIQSVDSLKLAQALESACAKLSITRNYLLQVNVSSDPAKGGFSFNEAEKFLAEDAAALPHLNFCGLMTITAIYDNPEMARPDFRALRAFRDKLSNAAFFKAALAGRTCELSMGMSADFAIAIEEGATMVRVGSAIFGERQKV